MGKSIPAGAGKLSTSHCSSRPFTYRRTCLTKSTAICLSRHVCSTAICCRVSRRTSMPMVANSTCASSDGTSSFRAAWVAVAMAAKDRKLDMGGAASCQERDFAWASIYARKLRNCILGGGECELSKKVFPNNIQKMVMQSFSIGHDYRHVM